MTKAELSARLLEYSIAILRPEDFHDQLAPAVMGYADLLSEYFVTDERDGREHIKTAHGNAIGPFWAARCVREIFRTQRFSRGLRTAVSDALKQNRNRPVQVLYAGTGPFATLALPVMMMFKPEEVQFTFLEINPESIGILKHVIDSFGLHAYVKEIYQCDAAVWEVPSAGIDIVISETMYKSLSAEPQVAIMLNLASQLPKDTVFLPEEIKVSLCKWNQKDKEPQKLAELIAFDKALMYAIIERSSDRNWVFADQQIGVSLSEKEQLYFMTEIRVNEGNILNLNDSSLNLLERIKIPAKPGTISLHCKYNLQGRPGFKISEN